jgi:hypothetical protein
VVDEQGLADVPEDATEPEAPNEDVRNDEVKDEEEEPE